MKFRHEVQLHNTLPFPSKESTTKMLRIHTNSLNRSNKDNEIRQVNLKTSCNNYIFRERVISHDQIIRKETKKETLQSNKTVHLYNQMFKIIDKGVNMIKKFGTTQ